MSTAPPPPAPPPPPGPAGSSAANPAMIGFEHCYRVYLGNSSQYLGMFLSVRGIGVQYEVLPYAEGGQNDYVRQLRGRMTQSNLEFTSGLTNQKVLLGWILGGGSLSGPQNIRIVFTRADGKDLRSFAFSGAVPIRWTGPNADIGGNAVATETLEVAHRGLLQPI